MGKKKIRKVITRKPDWQAQYPGQKFLTEDERNKIAAIRNKAKEMARLIDEVGLKRETIIAHDKLQECVQWATSPLLFRE